MWHPLTTTIPHSQDSEAVLEHLVTRGEAGRALALLRRPGVPQELSYKFAPALVAAAPAEAVDAWMAAQPALNPRHAPHPGTAVRDASLRIETSQHLYRSERHHLVSHCWLQGRD